MAHWCSPWWYGASCCDIIPCSSSKRHEIHVFTVPSDRKPHLDIHEGYLHVYFAANDHGSVNCSLAFEIFNTIKANGAFDYVHTERFPASLACENGA
ncbi:hypothetical protein CRYUN_Cryun38cG0042200 [Craigia yunnanensis]